MENQAQHNDEAVTGLEAADLVLSRTDMAGAILSGNSTFRQLTGYDWSELINAPHKLIRHPDMPQALFHMMWNNLRKNRPFGAYVKNRTKSGRHYWLFAVFSPIKNGYLSIRLKPSTEFFDHIRDAYAAIRAAERDGAGIDQGIAMMDEAVKAHDFRDYDAFMGYVLGAEIAGRCKILGSTVEPGIAEFEEMGKLVVALSGEVRQVKEMFDSISSSPKNLNILGSRLSTGREAIQVVAQNYELLSTELLTSILALAERLEALLDTTFQGRMGYCAAQLSGEAIDRFATEEPHLGTDGHKAELALLKAALLGFNQASVDGCDRIAQEVKHFVTLTARLRQMLSGLAVTRVVCRIEAAGVNEDTSSIDEISARLSQFQDELGLSLDRIGAACTELSHRIPRAGSDSGQRAPQRLTG